MTIKRIFSALVCAVMLAGFTACDKENEPNNENGSNNGGQTSNNQPEAVDLGLSVLWASCNVGANSPEEFGDFFAWGEVEPKANYNDSNYKWGTEEYGHKTKYNETDGKIVLDPEDDAATQNWGGDWRMPTLEEMTELLTLCTWTWTTQNGVCGCKVTSRMNGNSIFLPAADYRFDFLLDVDEDISYGLYWTSSLDRGDPEDPWFSGIGCEYADFFYFSSDDHDWNELNREIGCSVRAVCSKK